MNMRLDIDKAARGTGGCRRLLRGVFLQNCQHGRVIRQHGSAFAHVARSASQRHVRDRRLSTSRCRDDVIEVVHPVSFIEKLEDSPGRNGSSAGLFSAVATDPAIAFGDFVANGCRDISRVGHARRIALRDAARAAAGDALRPTVVELQASALALVERMAWLKDGDA